MSEETSPTIVIAVEIDDPVLADRLASLLDGVEGLRLAAPGEAADVAIVSRDPRAPPNRTVLTSRPANSTCWRCWPRAHRTRPSPRRLGISVHTAKFHVGSLLDKLDATGRTDAVAHAARRGVIHL